MTNDKKCTLTDEGTEAIAAVVLIAVVVSGVIFWLLSMPS